MISDFGRRISGLLILKVISDIQAPCPLCLLCGLRGKDSLTAEEAQRTQTT